MFYGDSMITPAITILSAMEDCRSIRQARAVRAPVHAGRDRAAFLHPEARHSAGGAFFGRSWCCGSSRSPRSDRAHHQESRVLQALLPAHGVHSCSRIPGGLLVLGAVFLTLTGGEALYATWALRQETDPIACWPRLPRCCSTTWPAAFILFDPDAIKNPFFRMVPAWACFPWWCSRPAPR